MTRANLDFTIASQLKLKEPKMVSIMDQNMKQLNLVDKIRELVNIAWYPVLLNHA